MDIKILQQIDGAKAATGLTVIIDVFRAFTVEAYLINNRIEKLYPVGDKETAYEYKRLHPEAILIGERNGVILDGFDYGNSPSQIKNVDFTGKTAVHTTSAGTQGIANAKNASEILTGSLVNARATAEYILKSGESDVSLVCMGLNGVTPTEEDTLCALYIESVLKGKPIEIKKAVNYLKKTSGKKFFDKKQQNVFPKEDFILSTEKDKFNFALKVCKSVNGLDYIEKVTV